MTKLSVHLRLFRADRPDEWTMDEFIRKAEKLEALLFKASGQIYDQPELEQEIEKALD